ncbi:hypothetical protein XENTR_v10004578 [Xenopus tropicalis]|nr:hypothetical protein XENTR_v10004578 [Xenopus tropicalis]
MNQVKPLDLPKPSCNVMSSRNAASGFIPCATLFSETPRCTPIHHHPFPQ